MVLALWTGLTAANADGVPEGEDADRPPAPAAAGAREEPDGTGEPSPGEYYIAITGRVDRVERLRGAGNLEPWLIALDSVFDKACLAACTQEGPFCWKHCAREDKARADQGIVSNSCGFMRTSYEAVRLARAGGGTLTFKVVSPFSTYSTLGEFCRLSLLAYDWESGYLLRKWGDSFYEEFHLELIFRAASGRYLVSPFTFSDGERGQIRDMFVPLKEEEEVCLVAGFLTLKRYEEMRNSPFARPEPQEQGPDNLCLTRALPLSLVLSAYKRLYPHR